MCKSSQRPNSSLTESAAMKKPAKSARMAATKTPIFLCGAIKLTRQYADAKLNCRFCPVKCDGADTVDASAENPYIIEKAIMIVYIQANAVFSHSSLVYININKYT